mgnify:CR=1 FL=1
MGNYWEVKVMHFSILSHKTASQGAAQLTVNEEIHAMIECYIRCLRPQVTPLDEFKSHVFLNTQGRLVKNFSGPHCLYAIQQEAGVPKKNLTQIRQATSGDCAYMLLDPVMHTVAQHQNDSRATSRAYYEARVTAKSGVTACEAMRYVLKRQVCLHNFFQH